MPLSKPQGSSKQYCLQVIRQVWRVHFHLVRMVGRWQCLRSMWSKLLVILVFSLLLGLVASRLFQISRRIRVIKLHRKDIHYFTIVNVCVLDVWFINSAPRCQKVPNTLRTTKEITTTSPDGDSLGSPPGPLQFGFLITYGIWANRVVGYN